MIWIFNMYQSKHTRQKSLPEVHETMRIHDTKVRSTIFNTQTNFQSYHQQTMTNHHVNTNLKIKQWCNLHRYQRPTTSNEETSSKVMWVYVHTRTARKDLLRNPREIQVDQRGQHVRRRLLTPKRTPPSATQWSNIVLRIMLRDINVVLHDTGCATWHMNCNICTVQYDIRHAYGGHKTLCGLSVRGQPYVAIPLVWVENTARDNALSSQLSERTTTEGTMPLEP